MPFQIIKGDIVSMDTDAIVYAETPQPFSLFNFNPLMIHKTGKEILNTRDKLKPIIIGQAKIAPASLLDCNYIIHTSAPAWHGGGYHELSQLITCYERVFELAVAHDCKSIAMPIIASDKLGYPKALSQKTAIEQIGKFLQSHSDITITLVLPGKTGIMLPGNQFTNVNMHLNKNFIETAATDVADKPDSQTAADWTTEKAAEFSSKLQSWMNTKGITEDELYFSANLLPETLTGILNGTETAPRKNTVAALGMALKLTLEELHNFMQTAGYSLTQGSKFDLIIKFCIANNMYDIFDVNQILFRFEQELLG